MGWYQIRLSIEGRRSAHNSINDDLDRVRMEWFLKDVKDLAEREYYKPLSIEVDEWFE